MTDLDTKQLLDLCDENIRHGYLTIAVAPDVLKALLDRLAVVEKERDNLRARETHPCIDNPCVRCRECEASLGTRSDRTHHGEVERLEQLTAQRDAAVARAEELRAEVKDATEQHGFAHRSWQAALARAETAERQLAECRAERDAYASLHRAAEDIVSSLWRQLAERKATDCPECGARIAEVEHETVEAIAAWLDHLATGLRTVFTVDVAADIRALSFKRGPGQ